MYSSACTAMKCFEKLIGIDTQTKQITVIVINCNVISCSCSCSFRPSWIYLVVVLLLLVVLRNRHYHYHRYSALLFVLAWFNLILSLPLHWRSRRWEPQLRPERKTRQNVNASPEKLENIDWGLLNRTWTTSVPALWLWRYNMATLYWRSVA